MKFCDACGNLLRMKTENDEKFLYCKSCDRNTRIESDVKIGVTKGKDVDDILVISEEEKSGFPVTQIMCPQCNEMREAEWTMQQTRGGDEPPTRFYQCKKCNWRWREYS
jgi:transcription factor S